MKIKKNYYKITSYMYHLKNSIKSFIFNCYTYRKELSKIKPWNEDYTFLKKHLEQLYICKTNDLEIEEDRNKKLVKLSRAISLLDNIIKDNYLELTEIELNLKYNYPFNFMDDFIKVKDSDYFEYKPKLTEEQLNINKQIIFKSFEIKQQQWNELWDIMKGQQQQNYLDDNYNDENFDGSGYNRWWS